MASPDYHAAIDLLKELIKTPSFSKEEDQTADILNNFFQQRKIPVVRSQNNILVKNKFFDDSKPTVLLNSHHDTVKPNSSYTKDPFNPQVDLGKLYGLGSNDAGGCLVALIATFLHFYDQECSYNLILAATAEEEISGKNGVESILNLLPKIDLAIVGEPTQMEAAVAEKGLLVVDATVKGKAGHAAREEGVNAIYEALDDLLFIQNYQFERESKYLGKTKMTATIIQAGTQHNVIPDTCNYTLDLRVTDAYSLEEALEEITPKLKATLVPRSVRLNSSKIPDTHRILKVLKTLNISQYGSPTLSDQALMPFPSLKMGPGDSARSHSADEFIYLSEIESGINSYIKLLNQYFQTA